MSPAPADSNDGPQGRRPNGQGGRAQGGGRSPNGGSSGGGGSRSPNRRRHRSQGGGGSRSGAQGGRSGSRGANNSRSSNRPSGGGRQGGSGNRSGSRPPRPEVPVPAPVPAAPTSEAPNRLSIGEDEIRANRRRAGTLCLGAGFVPGLVLGVVLGFVAGPIVGAVVGAVIFVGVALLLWRGATGLALRLIGGRRLEEDEEPRLANLVEGLCATFGVPRPALYLLEDPVPNACTLGRTPSDAALVVTTGLLDRLGLIEMEGVVAHELAHIKRADTVVASVTVGLVAPWIALGGSDRLVHRAVGAGREYRADQVAAMTVRYPPGLHDALATIERGPAPAPGSVFEGRRWAMTRWLWIDPMVGARQGPLIDELDATSVRVAALAEW